MNVDSRCLLESIGKLLGRNYQWFDYVTVDNHKLLSILVREWPRLRMAHNEALMRLEIHRCGYYHNPSDKTEFIIAIDLMNPKSLTRANLRRVIKQAAEIARHNYVASSLYPCITTTKETN